MFTIININKFITSLHLNYEDINTSYENYYLGYILNVKFLNLFKEPYQFSFNIRFDEMFNEDIITDSIISTIDNELKEVFNGKLYKIKF